MQFKMSDSWSAQRKLFRQHKSIVVAVPSLLRRHLNLTKGDQLTFHWIYSDQNTIVIKIIRDKTKKNERRGPSDERQL